MIREKYPPLYEPQPVEEPLTAKLFMRLLSDYVRAVNAGECSVERAALARAVDEVFRRLAT